MPLTNSRRCEATQGPKQPIASPDDTDCFVNQRLTRNDWRALPRESRYSSPPTNTTHQQPPLRGHLSASNQQPSLQGHLSASNQQPLLRGHAVAEAAFCPPTIRIASSTKGRLARTKGRYPAKAAIPPLPPTPPTNSRRYEATQCLQLTTVAARPPQCLRPTAATARPPQCLQLTAVAARPHSASN